jgi:hypothetical protein
MMFLVQLMIFTRIQIRAINTTDSPTLRMRLRVGGSDDSSSNYTTQLLSGIDTTASAARDATNTSFAVGELRTTRSMTNFTLASPFLSETTRFNGLENRGLPAVSVRGGLHNLTTSYTGATFFPSAGAMSGSISVYGYAKA